MTDLADAARDIEAVAGPPYRMVAASNLDKLRDALEEHDGGAERRQLERLVIDCAFDLEDVWSIMFVQGTKKRPEPGSPAFSLIEAVRMLQAVV